MKRLLIGLIATLAVFGCAAQTTDRLTGLSTSVAVKPPVKTVTTANITLSGEQTINSVAVVDGDRVLVKDQTDASENGIYIADASTWSRAPDFDGARDIVDGTLVVSNSGTSIYYRVTSNDPITIGTSDINFEVVSGAVSQSSIGAALYPLTSGEIAAGVSPTHYFYPPGNVLRYGTNSVPGTTDMSVALQSAINVVAQAGYGDVVVPRGVYDLQDDIYLHYDVTNNPNFPALAGMGGMINIVGEGWQDYTNHVNGHPQGSILDINAFQFKAGGGSQAARGVRFRNDTVVGDSTDYLVKFDSISRGTGFNDFTLFQDGTGGGIEMDDTFEIVLDSAFIASTNGSTTGKGLYIHNSSVAAGLYDLRQINVLAFAKNIVIGEETHTASLMSGIHMTACEGKDGQYNLILGNGVKAATIDNFHNEGATVIGVLVAWGATNVRFDGMVSTSAGASADYMSIGQTTGENLDDYTRNVVVRNSQFIEFTNTAIAVHTSGLSFNREISYSTFTGDAGTETAIELEDAVQHGLVIGPNNYDNVAVEVSNPTRADLIVTGDTLGRRTLNAPQSFAGVAMRQVDVASATDIAWVDTGNVWRLTGTTTVNTIAAPTAGNPVLTVICTANTTINDDSTSSGNIVLAGGANLSCTADDVLQLVWNSTTSKWLQAAAASVN